MVPSYVCRAETAYAREMVLLDMHCEYVKGGFGDEEGQEKVVGQLPLSQTNHVECTILVKCIIPNSGD